MNALKALVIGMGILIAAGLVVIAVTIVRRSDAPVAADADRPAVDLARSAPVRNLPPASFGLRDIPVPAGSEVMSIGGADGRVIVGLRDADGAPRILLLDPATGAALGGWRLIEGAAP